MMPLPLQGHVEPTRDSVKAPVREMWGNGEGEGKRDALRSNLAATDLYQRLIGNSDITALSVRTLDRLLFLSGVDPFLLSPTRLSAVSTDPNLTRLMWGYSLCDPCDYRNCELIRNLSDRALLLRLMGIRLSSFYLHGVSNLMGELVDGLGWGTMAELVPENEPLGGWTPHQLNAMETGEVAE